MSIGPAPALPSFVTERARPVALAPALAVAKRAQARGTKS
jgi:hypothetical protein